MVHQHFMLVPPLIVTENIMLGQESTTSGTRALGELAVLDRRAVSRRVRDLSRQYNIEVDPDAVVRNPTVGAQQRVEIIKALYRDADILILDEPTAVLTPQEADELFVVMHNLIRQEAPARTSQRSPLNTSRKLKSRWGASSVIKVKYGATKPHSSPLISLG
jgi:simple sugar transport system ATP-binding protein